MTNRNSPHLTSYPQIGLINSCKENTTCNNRVYGVQYKNSIQWRARANSAISRNSFVHHCTPVVRTLVRKDWGSCVHTPENGDIRATSKQKRSLMTAPAFCLTECMFPKSIYSVKRKPASRKAGKGTRAVNEVISSLGSISSSSTIYPHTVRELFPAFQGERRVVGGVI